MSSHDAKLTFVRVQIAQLYFEPLVFFSLWKQAARNSKKLGDGSLSILRNSMVHPRLTQEYLDDVRSTMNMKVQLRVSENDARLMLYRILKGLLQIMRYFMSEWDGIEELERLLQSREYVSAVRSAGPYDKSVIKVDKQGKAFKPNPKYDPQWKVLEACFAATQKKRGLRTSEMDGLYGYELELSSEDTTDFPYLLALKRSIYPFMLHRKREQIEPVIAALEARDRRIRVALPVLYRNPKVVELIKGLLALLRLYTDLEWLEKQDEPDVYTEDWKDPPGPSEADDDSIDHASKQAAEERRLEAAERREEFSCALDALLRSKAMHRAGDADGTDLSDVPPELMKPIQTLVNVSLHLFQYYGALGCADGGLMSRK